MAKHQSGDDFPYDYDLGPLIPIDPTQFFQGNQLSDEKAFVVALGTAFNDLKDYNWMWQQLMDNLPPEPAAIEAKTGQWHGMNIFVQRKIVATLYELFSLLKKQETLLQTDELRDPCLVMGANYQRSWLELVRASQGHSGIPEKDFRIYKFCKRTRSNIVSHYYEIGNFRNGLKKFHQTFPDQKLFMSLGQQMEQTRFYFSDAACQYFIISMLEEFRLKFDDVFKYSGKMNLGIRAYIDTYIKIQSGDIAMSRSLRRRYEQRTRQRNPRLFPY